MKIMKLTLHYRRRFDQTRGGGGSGFAFHHGRTEFRRGRRRENVQTFHFGGREFRYEFRQDGFQRQHWGRSRQTEGFGSSIALSLVLASVLFVVYMYLLIDKALEQGDHGQDYDGQEEPFSRQPEDSESEGEHRGRRFRTNAAGKRKVRRCFSSCNIARDASSYVLSYRWNQSRSGSRYCARIRWR